MAVATDRPIEVLPRGMRQVAAPTSASPSEWLAFFESIYEGAGGDAAAVPWVDGRANPALVSWLNAEAPGTLRPGATVVVVGCGLGDDVGELASRGYDAVGFDCSRTAVAWARRRHTDLADRLIHADLFSLPPGLLRRHDLVVEINTVQSLHPSLRPQAVRGIVSLARPRGSVLAICRGREEGEALPESPPYPLTASELESLFGEQGLAPARSMDAFYDDEVPPVYRLRGVFRRV